MSPTTSIHQVTTYSETLEVQHPSFGKLYGLLAFQKQKLARARGLCKPLAKVVRILQLETPNLDTLTRHAKAGGNSIR